MRVGHARESVISSMKSAMNGAWAGVVNVNIVAEGSQGGSCLSAVDGSQPNMNTAAASMGMWVESEANTVSSDFLFNQPKPFCVIAARREGYICIAQQLE